MVRGRHQIPAIPGQAGVALAVFCSAVMSPDDIAANELGHAADRALAGYADHGLELGGSRAQVTFNESRRLPAGPWCAEGGDVFALPADT